MVKSTRGKVLSYRIYKFNASDRMRDPLSKFFTAMSGGRNYPLTYRKKIGVNFRGAVQILLKLCRNAQLGRMRFVQELYEQLKHTRSKTFVANRQIYLALHL